MSSAETQESYACVPLSPELAGGLAELFDRCNNPCYCRYWHFRGDKYDWQLRCATAPELNRQELLRAAERRDATVQGIVAKTASARVIGWLKLTPAEALAKLYAQGPYRALPLTEPRDRVLSVGCMLVDEAYRQQGVARALLEAAIARARQLGASAIEAFPRRAEGRLPDAQAMCGPYGLFTAAGFVVSSGSSSYPVLRLEL